MMIFRLQMKFARHIHIAVCKVLCFCIFDELHHHMVSVSMHVRNQKLWYCSLCCKMFWICKNDVSWMAFSFSYANVLYVLSNEFIWCWHCNYSKCISIWSHAVGEFNLIQYFNQSTWHFFVMILTEIRNQVDFSLKHHICTHTYTNTPYTHAQTKISSFYFANFLNCNSLFIWDTNM